MAREVRRLVFLYSRTFYTFQVHITMSSDVIGQPLFVDDGFGISFGGGDATINDRKGNVQACFDPWKTLFCVKLRDPPLGPVVGPSWLAEPTAAGNSPVVSHFQWPRAEREKWLSKDPSVIEFSNPATAGTDTKVKSLPWPNKIEVEVQREAETKHVMNPNQAMTATQATKAKQTPELEEAVRAK
jgi:hypothetical protein